MKNHLIYKKTKLRQTLFVLVLLVIFVLAGCTNLPTEETLQNTSTPQAASEDNNDNPADPTVIPEMVPTHTLAPPNEVNPDDLDGIAIRFMHPWGGEEGDQIAEIATQFSLSNPWGIWVDVENLGSETALIELLQARLDDGDLPELIAVHPYRLSVFEGALSTLPLNTYFDHPDWGFTEDEREDIPMVFLDPFTVDETLIGLPVAPQATVLFYNQTWAEELGYSSQPENIVEFRQQVCAATFANLDDEIMDNDGTGGFPRNFDPQVLASWYRAFDGQLPSMGRLQFNTEAGSQAFGFLKSVDKEGCIWIHRQPEPFWYFANRYALIYAGTLDQIPIQMGWMNASQNKDQWVVTGFPGPDREVMLIDGPGLMVTADAPEKQMAAWLFARHLLEPEIQAQLVESLITLPVRKSAESLLAEFGEIYPQWAQTVSMMEIAEPLPASNEWGISQWVMQDAVIRLVEVEEDQTDLILEELDAMIDELEGNVP